jgi:hypothetical protein
VNHSTISVINRAQIMNDALNFGESWAVGLWNATQFYGILGTRRGISASGIDANCAILSEFNDVAADISLIIYGQNTAFSRWTRNLLSFNWDPASGNYDLSFSKLRHEDFDATLQFMGIRAQNNQFPFDGQTSSPSCRGLLFMAHSKDCVTKPIESYSQWMADPGNTSYNYVIQSLICGSIC